MSKNLAQVAVGVNRISMIWKLVTGEDPTAIIDHKDRDSRNNRWRNLREATKSQNNINSTVKLGVTFDRARNKWQAYVKVRGKNRHLGRFDTKIEALTIRAKTARELYGEFAP